MMDGNDLVTEASRRGIISQAWTRISQVYQGTLDRWTPHTKSRWVGSFVLLLLFMLRIFAKQGWYIVTYALGIYHLNLFIAFLTPKIDPAMDFDGDDDNGPALPTRATEEFRPFIRRLPEFKFWLSVTKSTLIGFCCTFIDAFNIPVFWPILVMYFITLFCITMKRQIKPFWHLCSSLAFLLSCGNPYGSLPLLKPTENGHFLESMASKTVVVNKLHEVACEHNHMIKYRYLPFTHSKPKYKTVDSTVTVN